MGKPRTVFETDYRAIALGGGFDRQESADGPTIGLAQTATIRGLSSAGVAVDSLNAQVNLFDWSDTSRPPRAITLDFGLASGATGSADYPTPFSPAGLPYCYRGRFLVSYGTAGYRTRQILLDFGQRICVSANMIGVSVQALQAPAGYAPGSMTVGAALGFGAATSLAAPFSTVFVDALGFGASTPPIIVPPRSNYLLPVQMSNVAGVCTVVFQDASGAGLFALQFGAGALTSPWPLPGSDVYQCIVTNNLLAGSMNIRLPFQING